MLSRQCGRCENPSPTSHLPASSSQGQPASAQGHVFQGLLPARSSVAGTLRSGRHRLAEESWAEDSSLVLLKLSWKLQRSFRPSLPSVLWKTQSSLLFDGPPAVSTSLLITLPTSRGVPHLYLLRQTSCCLNSILASAS